MSDDEGLLSPANGEFRTSTSDMLRMLGRIVLCPPLPALARWLDYYAERVAAQLKTRSSLGPNSIGAVEAALRQVDRAFQGRSQSFGNRRRLNLPLDLMTLHARGKPTRAAATALVVARLIGDPNRPRALAQSWPKRPHSASEPRPPLLDVELFRHRTHLLPAAERPPALPPLAVQGVLAAPPVGRDDLPVDLDAEQTPGRAENDLRVGRTLQPSGILVNRPRAPTGRCRRARLVLPGPITDAVPPGHQAASKRNWRS
jgi:hypothetical protein